MRAFLTGLGGFVAGHLATHLRVAGDFVTGLARPGTSVPPGEAWAIGDVRDAGAVAAAIGEARPDAIYHLAAIAHVGASWERSRETYEVNFLGALSVLEAAKKLDPRPRVLLVGSAEEYGRVAKDGPIEETAPLQPLTPYGVSKAAQELLGRQMALAEGLPVIVVRSFNHTGPGQEPTFVISEWAKAVAEIEAGIRPPLLEVGHLDAVRDFSDVRDIVRLYRLLVEKGRVGESYNACSGVGRALTEVVETLRKLARRPFDVRPRGGSRPADVRTFVGSREKTTRETGWEPHIAFETTVAGVLDHWRAKVQAG